MGKTRKKDILNAEQLNSARLARWSQNGEARLTLEGAREWLDTIGFCPYLPGHAGGAPAASFVEAVVGRPAQTPSAGERSRAGELLARMIENVAGVPMKFGPTLGEQPDFIASTEVLRYIYSLRGDRNFKNGPATVGNDKVTPLALHCWEAIREQGPLDVPALQPLLGRDITEAAIARALQELWTHLYVFPILSMADRPAKWELLSRRFPEQVAAGASTGQAESQSALVSLYLHAVVAAAEEEVLAFLSPLAPQSKLREVIRALGSMRQLDIIDIDGRAHVCLQGGLLPEMVAQLSEEQLGIAGIEAGTNDGVTVAGGIEIERAPIQSERPARAYGEAGAIRKFVPKKFIPRHSESRTPIPGRFGMQASGQSAVNASRPRSAGNYPSHPRTGTFNSGDSDTRRLDSAKSPTRGMGERAKRWEKSGERPGREGRERSERRSGGNRPFAAKSSFKPSGFKAAGVRQPGTEPWTSKSGSLRDKPARSWTQRTSADSSASSTRNNRSGDDRPKRWEKPAAGGRPSGVRPYAGKSDGFKAGGAKPWVSKAKISEPAQRNGGARPGRWEKPRPSAGVRPATRKSFGAKPGGKQRGIKSPGAKPWVSRGAESRVGSARSYAARAGGKARGQKSWARTSEGGDAAGKPKRSEKPESGSEARTGERSVAKPFWAKNPRGGKGSVAASRTNRPRGKKSGKKK